MKKRWSLAASLLVLLSLGLLPAIRSTDRSSVLAQVPPGARLIASTALGVPVAAGHYLIWPDSRSVAAGQRSVYGYDLNTNQEFLIANDANDKYSFATDGTLVVWVEVPSGTTARIQSFNLNTRQSSTILEAAGPAEFGDLAVDGAMLYYLDNRGPSDGSPPANVSETRNGLYARNLQTGQESLISSTAQHPVAADGILLWSEEVQYRDDTTDPSGTNYITPLSLAQWRLHLTRDVANTSPTDTVIAQGMERFSGYQVSGDKVVWAFRPGSGDGQAYVYRLSSGSNQLISSQTANNPLIKGNDVAWTTTQSSAIDQPRQWSVYKASATATDSSTTSTVIEPNLTQIEAWAILAPHTLVFTMDQNPDNEAVEVWITDLGQGSLSFPAPPGSTSPTANTCDPPINCLNVYKSSRYLYDAGGRWPVNGVQFIPPAWGINPTGFYDVNYNEIYNDGSLRWWLGIIGRKDGTPQYLLGRTVRIFIQAPSPSGVSGTSFDTIWRFTRLANEYKMRVGLTFQFFPDAGSLGAMTTQQRNWFQGLINYLKVNNPDHVDWTPVIAYANAENEINNHCPLTVRQQGDCYDSFWYTQNGQQYWWDGKVQYINSYNKWVRDFAQVFRSNSRILTTVGISTEMPNRDNLPPGNNFFRWPTDGTPRIVDSVDFLSPHNYSGDADGVYQAIRVRQNFTGPTQPVVLEEYGWPTDPYLAEDPLFVPCTTDPTAGPPRFIEQQLPRVSYREGCWDDPYNPIPGYCARWRYAGGFRVPAASLYVETQARVIRGQQGTAIYAGGVSWMAGDMNGKNCSSPRDVFMGVFSAGDASSYNCNPKGTCALPGSPKAPAFRVRTQHYYYTGGQPWQP